MKIKLIATILFFGQLLGQSIQVGDVYRYNVYFEDLIKLGEANLKVVGEEIVRGSDTFHMQFSIKTSSIGDKVYKIRNSVDSWIKKDDFTVLKQIKKSRERNFKRDYVTEVFKNKATSNSREFLVPEQIFDPYSLILTLQNLYDISTLEDRNIDRAENTVIHFDILDGPKTRKISLHNSGINMIRTPLGKFKAVTFRPNNPIKNGEMEISYGYYNNRLVPIKISLALNSGVIVMKVKEIIR